MVVAVALPAPAARVPDAQFDAVTRLAYACLLASHQRIEESRALIRAAHRAEARTHALGVQYADWRLRPDIATELHHLTDGLD